MKNIVILFIILSFIACKKEPFIDNFNNIEHYRLVNESLELSDKKLDKDVILQDFPNKINDTVFFNYINSSNWIKNTIGNEQIEKFKNIFNGTDLKTKYETACIPIYRDIYILKQNSKVTGIFKVCYGCQMYYFIGQSKDNKKVVKIGSFNPTIIQNILEAK